MKTYKVMGLSKSKPVIKVEAESLSQARKLARLQVQPKKEIKKKNKKSKKSEVK